jgi:hydrogenase maturation protease
MADIVVIGCGNPLRGDDGIGWMAVDELAGPFSGKNIRFLKCRELTPELSEELRRAKYALFIDASVEPGSGTVRESDLLPAGGAFDTHKLDPAGLLSLSEAIYGNSPRSVLLSLKGESFGYEERLSRSAADSMSFLVSRAGDILRGWTELTA